MILETIDVFVTLAGFASWHRTPKGLLDGRSCMCRLEVVVKERWGRTLKQTVGDGASIRLLVLCKVIHQVASVAPAAFSWPPCQFLVKIAVHVVVVVQVRFLEEQIVRIELRQFWIQVALV